MGGAVLSLTLLFSGKSQTKGRCRSERCQIGEGVLVGEAVWLEGLLDFWQSLDGGAVLGLMVLFSGKSQNKGSQKSERSQVFSGLKSDSSGVLWIYRVQTRT
jgi:hypothetical protein